MALTIIFNEHFIDLADVQYFDNFCVLYNGQSRNESASAKRGSKEQMDDENRLNSLGRELTIPDSHLEIIATGQQCTVEQQRG